MKKQCHQCGYELDSLLPFKCRHCGELYCKDHYLPENHHCPNLPRSGWLIKNQYRPSRYHEQSHIQESFPEIKVNRRTNYRDDNIHRDNNRLNSYKHEIKRLSMKMLRNKWFWIIGLPIILILILYTYVWLSYGQTWANFSLYFIIIFIVIILMMIFLPRRKPYDPIREGIYHDELIREQARNDFKNNRRRRW